MNEKLIELLHKVKGMAYPSSGIMEYKYGSYAKSFDLSGQEFEQFIKLIVNECAVIASDAEIENVDCDLREAIGIQIKNHFGMNDE